MPAHATQRQFHKNWGIKRPLFCTFSTQFLEQSSIIPPKKTAKGWYLAISRPKTCVLRSVLLLQTNIFSKQTNKMGTKHPKNTPFGTQFRHFRVPHTQNQPKTYPKSAQNMPQTCPELSTLDTPHSFTTFVPLRSPFRESILYLCMDRSEP